MAQKPKPERDKKTITLKESQRISLIALQMERQRFDGEIKQLQAEIQKRVGFLVENESSMKRILFEIEGENEMAKDSLSTAYQFDGEKFIQAGN